jgi:hypothetical protein
MTKVSGMGDNLYVGGYDLSNDIGSLKNIHGGPSLLVVTGIDKSAFERLGGLRDGGINFNSFMNDSAGRAHTRLKTLPTADIIVSYFRGTTLGGNAASIIAKQIDYNLERDDNGNAIFTTDAQANSFGLEWGVALTAGIRQDTTATSPATGIDTTGSLSFGGQAYLHLFAFTGTSVTVKIQDSADNASFADITPSLVFTTATGITSERIAVTNTTTIRQYVRVITTGTFSVANFAVNFVKNQVAGQVF